MNTTLKAVRKSIIHKLWESYCLRTPQMQTILNGLKQRNIHEYSLDHLAVIDLKGPNTGIPQLSQLFSHLGYQKRGQDYLPDKQNDFLWMAEIDASQMPARTVLPQVVTADFRPHEMSNEVRTIIEKYSHLAPSWPFEKMQILFQSLETLREQSNAHDEHTTANENLAQSQITTDLINMLANYFSGRDWPLPTKKEFETVHAENELLAWVLIYGRRPNHFTLSIHLFDQFKNLNEFNEFLETDLSLPLNTEGGAIKGNRAMGIEQSSTMGVTETIALADGDIELPMGFVEFVWRFPQQNVTQPYLWQDYFTDFIGKNANYVIESLYTGSDPDLLGVTEISRMGSR